MRLTSAELLKILGLESVRGTDTGSEFTEGTN